MYNIKMKYLNQENMNENNNFKCEKFAVSEDGYRFETIMTENFIIPELEIKKEDIAMIRVN